MSTFSFGATPGAPGTYINETVGNIATAGIASFSTVYMLVETEESVPVTVFPFNRPIIITSLADYRALIGGAVPTSRIPLLSFNCVNAFFQNAQVGDLRVVRVGTPNQIVEVEILSNGTKIGTSGLPSTLEAGDVVYAQLILNGSRLVAGDGSTGYSAEGEWLGVPVTVPVDYINGDAANNRKITKAIAMAVAEAIESNPSIRNSVYVRDYGLVNDIDTTSNSENAFISVSATTYDGVVTVIPQHVPVGSIKVMMDNFYDIQNVVGLQNVDRVPQDYIQCINTAFDGQRDQGYLVTPTAYAQFDGVGRAAIGAAAAAHCQSNDFKWMALVDPGPFLVTGINKYKDYVPHLPASDLVTGFKYLVDNAIYEWTGANVNYDRLRYQPILSGANPEVAVKQSKEAVALDEKVGALDLGIFSLSSGGTGGGDIGKFTISSSNVWPVDLQVTEVTIAIDGSTGDFATLFDPGETSKNVFIVAPPYNEAKYGLYPSNGADQIVYIAETASAAASVYTQVKAQGGSATMTAAPSGAWVVPGAPVGSEATVSYGTPAWDFIGQIEINGQSSNLIQNITGGAVNVNLAHLPGTLQDSTEDYRLGFFSRAFLNPSDSTNTIISHTIDSVAYCKFKCMKHGLNDGQQVFFTNPVETATGVKFKATTANGVSPFFVKVLDNDHFLLAASSANYQGGAYVTFGTITTATPTILYSRITGGRLTALSLSELSTVPMIRGRKYGFSSGTSANEVSVSTANPAPVVSSNDLIEASIYLNKSNLVLGDEQVFPYGETVNADWLPKLDLVNPGSSTTDVNNYLCVPTTEQSFGTEAYLVPAFIIRGGDYSAAGAGALTNLSAYCDQILNTGATGAAIQAQISKLAGVYFNVTAYGNTPDGESQVRNGDKMVVKYDGSNYSWIVIPGGIVIPGEAINRIETLGNLSGGSGYTTSGVYNNVALTGGSGTGAKANITVAAGAVTVVTITDRGEDYEIGDSLSAASAGIGGIGVGGTTFSIVVTDVETVYGDLTSAAQVCHGSQVELSFTPEQTPPSNLWRFDAITSTEIMDHALRGVGFNGEPQAEFIEAGVDNVNRLYEDSQRYLNPFGFIAYYGPYVLNASGQYIPPTPYVTGVALRRYRAEGFQFPPAGVKYQLADAIATQIAINSAQQNLLNPDGCNAVRTLPGYPDTSVYIWGGRTRINKAVADQRKFQFVNVRVIQNIVYGSLRNAFDNQIFSVIDGFGVLYNQITSIGTSVLSQLWISGALFGARPSDAFQVICDDRINRPENLENGLVYVKVFDVPVPTMERLEVDLIRVSIGQMGRELESQNLS